MPANIKIIHSHEFIKATTEGQLDVSESKKLLNAVALTVGPLSDFEIILDTRKAHSTLTKIELWYLAKELCKFQKRFNHKIAIICPHERSDYAEFFALCSQNRGFEINAYTSFEDAIEWLTKT